MDTITTWAIEQLQNDDYYAHLTNTIVKQLQEYYSLKNKQAVLAKLQEKMTAGAVKHNTPSNIETVLFELEQEQLDLLGWNMVKEWINQKSN